MSLSWLASNWDKYSFDFSKILFNPWAAWIFSEKIKDIYLSKKKKRMDMIGVEENNNLEKKIFLQILIVD